jgi:AAA+ ATPase superfamily predicted ATPase
LKIFGREKQISKLKSLVESKYPEFNVVYGRRRIGKTFLIREFFENNFFFDYTGNKNITNQQEVRRFSKQIKSTSMLNNWDECFDYLKQLIINSQTLNKKVVFLDEISWLDKHKSGFINSLEYFWNHFASSRS